MKALNIRNYRLLGLVPIGVLIWHGLYTALYLEVDFLLFICYPANLLLGIGILVRSGLLTGAGFGWTVIGFPLWLFYAITTSDWEISGVMFHIGGMMIGIMTIKYCRYPKYTWSFAMALGILFQQLARWFTNPSLNINAAFRVYQGWEFMFSDYRIYSIVMALGFSLFFIVLTRLNHKCVEKVPNAI